MEIISSEIFTRRKLSSFTIYSPNLENKFLRKSGKMAEPWQYMSAKFGNHENKRTLQWTSYCTSKNHLGLKKNVKQKS